MAPRCESVPVLVWGGGSGGVAAAIQAARSGARTLLLTPGAWLGGMVSAAGVCCPDGHELTPWQTGLWGALLRALATAEPEGLDHNWVSCFGYRPTTAEAILQGWVRQLPTLEWWSGVRLLAVERRARQLTGVTVLHAGETVQLAPQVVIDGSDRGDLLPLAAVPYRLGWEPQERWGEPSAPPRARLEGESFFADQPVQSPTWVVIGQLARDRWHADPTPQDPPASEATAAALPAPFEQACSRFGLERTISYGRLPGGLVMLNWPLHGNDWHQGLQRAFRNDAGAEAELAEQMQQHSLAFAAALGEASGGWLQLSQTAFPADCGAAAPWLALMPYWREGRRLVGQNVVIETDLLPQGPGEAIGPLPCDASGRLSSIAVGTYANDHHYPGPDWPLAPKSCRWGGRWSGTPFCIPYGALVSEAVDNLLAADKAFSTSHMANGATRLQPLILNIGQAAGAAAALALELAVPPGVLPLQRLQEALLHDPQAPAAVVPLWDTPWHHPRWRQRQLAVLADPSRIGLDGRWQGDGDDPAAPAPAGERSAPPEPGERLWQGQLQPDRQGGFLLALAPGDPVAAMSGRSLWPLITLEPGLHQWLHRQEGPRPVRLLGTANPWGPWLRLSRLLDA
ncbi:MAG: FAD-dependent oxidoreductase [Cyanobium sp.]